MPYIVLDPSLAMAAPVTTLGEPLVSEGETLLTLREELSARLAGRTDVSAGRLDRFINHAYLDLCSTLDLPELRGSIGLMMTIGESQYILPDVVRSIISLSLNDATDTIFGGRQLRKTDVGGYRQLEDASGEPSRYFRWGSNPSVLVVWPKPSRAVTLVADVKLRPAKLVNDTDSPILPEEWHEGILLLARAKAFSALLEPNEAAVARNDFVSFANAKRNAEAEEDDTRIIASSVPRDWNDIVRNTSEPRYGTY